MAMALADPFDPEEPVIDAIRGGDRYAFGEFVRRQHRFVQGVILGVLGRHDRVEDVAQEVWTAVWQRIGDLRDTRRWRPWLYRLCRNAAIDTGRDISRRRGRTQPLLDDVAQDTTSATADAGLAGDERHSAVMTAIHALPVLYREPFVLRHVSGWSYKEIASVMGMPVDTVETRLVRARRFLRESLKDQLN